MARPRKQLNVKTIETLAMRMVPVADMALILDCSKRTLEVRYLAVIEQGRAKARKSLLSTQFSVAMGGNVAMLIWLGKQCLGQKDRQILGHEGQMAVTFADFIRASLVGNGSKTEKTADGGATGVQPDTVGGVCESRLAVDTAAGQRGRDRFNPVS